MIKELKSTTCNADILDYSRKTIKTYAAGIKYITFLPNVFLTHGETDYCGELRSYGTEDCIVRATVVLNIANIIETAAYENISPEQCLDETLYHEFIHFMHAIAYADDDEKITTHTGELWDDMILTGIHDNFITREAI